MRLVLVVRRDPQIQERPHRRWDPNGNVLDDQHLGLLSGPKITFSLSHWTNVPQWEQEAGNSSGERMLAGDWSFQKKAMMATMGFPQTISEHTT